MRVYYHNDTPGDCRLPHNSGLELSPEYLLTLGIYFDTFPPSSSNAGTDVSELASSRNYTNRDEITVSPDAMGATYEDKIQTFYEEHIHEDEEIRYVLKGSGYFDVRDPDDEWIRIAAGPGDLLILPAGIYHRFTVDENNYIHAMRLFQTQPKWAALNRGEETEMNQFRKDYVLARGKSFA